MSKTIRSAPNHVVLCRCIASALAMASLSQTVAEGSEYRLHSGDILEIAVVGMPELKQRVTVQVDGSVSLPLLGTIAVAGRVGAHCGYGMRRGTLVFAGPQPPAPPTFVATQHDIAVFWALLRRSLAYHGGLFASLPAPAPRRLVGDLAVDGKGEWLLLGRG